MDQKSRNPEYSESAPRGDLARSLLSRGRWARAVLSPWVRRSLPARAGGGIVRRRRVAFSEGHTRALVERVQRRVESSRVWRPDVGAVALTTWRLADGIVERYQPITDKYRVQSPEEGAEPEAELPLAPGWLFSGIGGLPPQRRRVPAAPPPIPVSPAPAAEPSLPAAPRAPSRPALLSRQPARAEPGREAVRAFSRVEEITPASVPPAEAVMPERPHEEQAGVVEEEAVPLVEPDEVSDAPPRTWVHEARPPAKAAPPTPPTVRRPDEQETPARRPPRVELPLVGEPEVPRRRLPDEPPPGPAVAQEEMPLSALPQPGEPPGAAPPVRRRVEDEVTPGPPSREARPGLPAAREVVAAQPETPLEPDRPAEPPAPQLDWEMPLPTPPSVEAEPLRPPVSREAVPVQPEAPLEQLGQPAEAPTVERQLDQEMPLPAPPPIEARPPRPPVSREVTPAQLETPVTPDRPVERQLDQDMPLPAPPPIEARPARPPIGREVVAAQPEALPGVEQEATPVQPEAEPEPDRPAEAPSPPPVFRRRAAPGRPVSGLEQEVLARAAQGARLPLTEAPQLADRLPPAQERVERPEAQLRLELPPVPQARPPGRATVLRMPQPAVQARLESQEAATRGVVPGWSQAVGEALPLPPVSRPASPERVQREVVEATPELATPSGEAGVIQRVTATAPGGSEASAGGGPDLNRLARQVYPFIKRMLAVERERRLSR